MSLTEQDYNALKSLITNFAQGQAELQSQLFQLQKSPAAWQWSALLLQQESDPNLRFFAASTISVKISRDFDSLSTEDALPLKSSLLTWLVNSARLSYPQNAPATSSERIVTRKLAVAVCLAFQKQEKPVDDQSCRRRTCL
jgi:hypothetical protein